MSIEQDIQQPTFDSDHEKAAVNILYTGSWLYQINFRRLKKHGITPEQFNVLRILRGAHPRAIRLADISSRMIDKSSNCTRLVEKLRQKGLVNRELCEDNRRQVDIRILPAGLTLLKKIDAESDQWLKALKNISKADARQLSQLLDKLRG